MTGNATALPQMLPDNELVNNILAGDKRVFEVLIRRYNQRLYRIGMSVLSDEAETEDAMQAAYISAYEHLSQFQHRSAFGTWLTRIMLNQCYLQRKKNNANRADIVVAENTVHMTTPANILVNKELNSLLERAIAGLPDKYRLVFVLREVEELSVKETAAALDIEEANVKVRLNRAKAMLRNNLGGYMKDNVYSFHLQKCDRIVAKVLGHLNIS